MIFELKKNTLKDKRIDKIIVVDNGSTDSTVQVAIAAGASVVSEPQKGYGAACLRGIKEIDSECDVVLFIDGDGSDVAKEWLRIVEPIFEQRADIVVGSRVLGDSERGALSPHQRFGNMLASFLLRALYGKRVTDLGPFRALRTDALAALEMDDMDFGWTVQMQARALKQGLRYEEVPVSYRRRQGGVSKISGNLWASFLAGRKILRVIFGEYFRNGSKSF